MRLVLMLGLAALGACNLGENKTPQSNSVGSNEDQASPSTPDESGPSSPQNMEVPSIAMPEFAPQYPGSTIRSVNSSQAVQNVHEVTLETSDDAPTIMDFYRDKFSAAGLQKTSDFQSGGTGMLSAVAKKRKASIAITKSGAINLIIVTYSGD